MLEKLFKKLHSDKGLTGADVAVSISIIVLTIAVVSAIYVNATNKSKEEIRYSAATRIATQIIENIESMTYDEVVYRYENSYNSVDADSEGNTYNVTVPEGYSAEVTMSEVDEYELDVVRDITVNVTYKISGVTKSITLYTVKEKELLEQTNEPDVTLIDGYDSSNYYAIKYSNGSYVVTTTSDSDWYNYDDGEYALVYYSSSEYDYGDTISVGSVKTGTTYIWVPRFGVDFYDELEYCYGTSDYAISFELYDGLIYSYVVSGSGSGESYTMNEISAYIEETFETNDGLTGVWYAPNGDNDSVATTAFETLDYLEPITNF